jgi:hypothetical protein
MRPTTDPVLIANLIRHVDCLAGLIGPRPLSKFTAFTAAATYVERELAKAGYEVSRQTYTIGNKDVANIIAELPGGTKKEEIVILGAHYDTVFMTPGADDNASAVAVLIETARLVRNLNPARTIRFVGFACEEPPHFHTGEMGSQVHARQCRIFDERIIGMLCLEMVGYYTTVLGSQNIPPGIPRTISLSEAIFSLPWETCVLSGCRGSFVAGSNEPCSFPYFRSACPNRFRRFGCPTTALFGTRATRRSCLPTQVSCAIPTTINQVTHRRRSTTNGWRTLR